MFTTLIVFQVLTAAGLIAIVLVQRGPGATMGAAFGSGASGTVFGSRGAGNFLTRTTSWLAVGFMGISLALAVLATDFGDTDASALSSSVTDQPEQSQEPDAGAALESAIDELDNPPAEQQGAPAGEEGSQADAAPADEGDEGQAGEENGEDGNLPEPPQGS